MYFTVVDGETPAQSAEEILKLATQIEEKVLRKILYLNSEVSYNELELKFGVRLRRN